VRVDTGVEAGSVIGGNFDSLLAKIIVTGADRAEALDRARRVLDETVVEGMATVLPFHRLVVRDPAFIDFTVHTRWIETEWQGGVEAFVPAAAQAADAPERETVVVEVGGKRLEVRLPANLISGTRTVNPARPPARRSGSAKQAAGGGAAALAAPMQGTIVKVAAQDGDLVAEGDVIVVVEAMKMEQPLQAHRSGTVSGLSVEVGATVTAGATICEIS